MVKFCYTLFYDVIKEIIDTIYTNIQEELWRFTSTGTMKAV